MLNVARKCLLLPTLYFRKLRKKRKKGQKEEKNQSPHINMKNWTIESERLSKCHHHLNQPYSESWAKLGAEIEFHTNP